MTTEGLQRPRSGASTAKAATSTGRRPVDSGTTAPITFMAYGGLLVVLLMVYVWGKWITGPNFKRVPPGPTPAPDWMIVTLRAFEIGGIILAAFVIWRFVVRPWRRDGRPSTDGLLIIGFATVWFQDPFSTYYVNWFTYNTNLINFGSWVQDVPGWVSYGGPGHTIAEPIVFIGASYVYFLFISVVFGTWVMRALKQRWPNVAPWQQLVVCFVAMCLVDLVAEGLIWMPLGFWSYPGGHGVLFPSTYHKFAVEEMVPIGLMFTGLSALRYFRDDRGSTLAERGVERLNASPRRIAVTRVLAVLFAVHAITFLLYTIPAAWWVTHPVAWPQDTMNRSYFTSGLCGDGTDRACSGPGVPFATNKSAYMTRDGKLGFPPGHAP
jgi:Spirocyclase AveC-like